MFNMKFNDELDNVLYELILQHATKAERTGPGGFNRCIELLLEKLTGIAGSSQLQEIAGAVWAPSISDMRSMTERHSLLGGSCVGVAVATAVELAGFGGRIIIEKTSARTMSVELVRGYTFELRQLLPIDVSFVHPRACCIDGYIENVAEVHHLLEAAAEAKEPCALFVRGVSDDVKHTLKTNYDRGSLKVLPIGVNFDLEGMNTLNDLSVTLGCDLVSSLKGDLISSIRFHELPRVDQVTVYKGKVVIVNACTTTRVNAHVAQLRSRREAESIDDVGSLLDKRIRSLSPNHVVIRVPDDKDFVVSSQSIDYSLRAARSLIEHGVMKNGELAATELAAHVHADRCAQTIAGIGAYLSA